MHTKLRVVKEKARSPITLDAAYKIVFEQYNMHLIKKEAFEGHSKWSWDVEDEPEACIPPNVC
jgi:hypothetical protein